MTARTHDYRVRIAGAEDDQVAGNVEFTLQLVDLSAPPVVTGQIAHPTVGRTESRPFAVLAIDNDGALTAALTIQEGGFGRWKALGRLCDVQFDDSGDGTNWTTFGTGRISMLDEADGPGRYRIEISDESWRARKTRIFEQADTTHLWPAGISAAWRGFPAAFTASATLEQTTGDLHRLRVTAGGFGGRFLGRNITDNLIRWIDSDTTDEISRDVATVESNFKTLRLNYGGLDYTVVSFGQTLPSLILDTLRNPVIENPQAESKTVTVRVWVHSPTTPPSSGEAYLHAPTAAPSDELPLHVGLADPAHDWGTTTGWIHPATLTRRYWELTNQAFDSVALTALEADRSYPALALRVTETPANPEEWFADNVWGPLMLIALRDSQGRRKLIDMRLPQDLDPDTLPLLDASNTNASTWRLTGTEAVNSIEWGFLHTSQFPIGESGSEPQLDGLHIEERTDPPRVGDTIPDMGRRSLNLKLLGALEPTASIGRTVSAFNAGGVQWTGAVDEMSRELFDIFQDGAFKLRGEIGRTEAEQLTEGDLALVELGSLGLPPCR